MTDDPAHLDEFVRPHWESSALLVVDMQNDFTDDGPLPVAGTTGVVPALASLAVAFRRARRPIVHVVRLYAGDDVDLVRRGAISRGDAVVRPGSAGSLIVDALLPGGAPPLDHELLLTGAEQPLGPLETAMWKPRWSAFHRTALDARLRRAGIDTVVVAGCNFPNCPRATLFDASSRDYRAVVATDATSGVDDARLTDARGIGVVPLGVGDIARRVAAL